MTKSIPIHTQFGRKLYIDVIATFEGNEESWRTWTWNGANVCLKDCSWWSEERKQPSVATEGRERRAQLTNWTKLLCLPNPAFLGAGDQTHTLQPPLPLSWTPGWGCQLWGAQVSSPSARPVCVYRLPLERLLCRSFTVEVRWYQVRTTPGSCFTRSLRQWKEWRTPSLSRQLSLLPSREIGMVTVLPRSLAASLTF